MFRTVLFAFINCLIISTPLLKERNRLRNEFIGRRSNLLTDRFIQLLNRGSIDIQQEREMLIENLLLKKIVNLNKYTISA
jgi:hypothetical protein